MAEGRPARCALVRLVRRLGPNVVLATLALVILEGLSSAALLVWDVAETPRRGESYHTQYDAELGWVNIPGLHLPNMYGPGVSLTTSSRGFRSTREIAPDVAPGRIRVICSGDSFTLGYGVDDDHTWCQALEALDPRVETLNMGQGGYGIDQAYLWFKRDAREIRHQLHLLAVITDDFIRLGDAERGGYGKPFLELQGERLVVRNTPVPKRAWFAPWITRHLESLRSLRSFELARRLLERTQTASGKRTGPRRDRVTGQIVSKLLEDLVRINQGKGSALVLVYLPYLPEHRAASAPGWERFLENESQRLRLLFISVADEFRALPRAEAEALFIPEGPGIFPGAGGHLSVRGNQFVARVVFAKLSALPAFHGAGEER